MSEAVSLKRRAGRKSGKEFKKNKVKAEVEVEIYFIDLEIPGEKNDVF
jgi:hypothetical protein